jgi:hypothetical protein
VNNQAYQEWLKKSMEKLKKQKKEEHIEFLKQRIDEEKNK